MALEGMDELIRLQELANSLVPPLPRVEAEVRLPLVPPSPFFLGDIKDIRKQEDEKYVEAFKRLFDAAKKGRAAADERWKRAFAAYTNSYDFGYKSPHQAKAFAPRLTRNVDVVAQFIRQALTQNQEFFRVFAVSSRLEDLAAAHAIELMVRYILDMNNLHEKLTKWGKMALLYGLLIGKVYVSPEKVTQLTVGDDGKVTTVERTAYKVKVDIVYPQDIWLDPTGRNKFLIHRVIVDKSDLYDYADIGLLNRDAVDRLVEKAQSHTEKSGAGDKVEGFRERHVYALLEYWGDWWDKDGNLLHRNIWMIFGAPLGADGGILPDYELMRGPMPNPYWHQRPPFVISSVTPEPSISVYPHSLADFLIDLQREYTRLLNAMIDGAIFDAVRIFEVNAAVVENPKDVEDLWSGKIIKRRFGEGQAIMPVQLGKMPTEAAFMINLMERYLMEGFGVTETVMGYLASRGRPTATEVVTARAHAFSAIEEMAAMIEGNFVEPLLEMVFMLAMQVLPDIADDEMLRALGDASDALRRLLSLSPQEREAIARGGYRFRVKGARLAVSKVQELAKINEFIQIISQIPNIAARINWDALMSKVLEAYGWSPDELLVKHPLLQHASDISQLQTELPTPEMIEGVTETEGQTQEAGSMEDIAGILQGML